MKPLIDEAHDLGVRVSLFMDPAPDAMATAASLGADRVELYTESFARAWDTRRSRRGARDVRRRGACGAAPPASESTPGHDLNRDNLEGFLVEVPGVLEVSIGHALIADALEFGLAATVRAYLACIERATMRMPAR